MMKPDTISLRRRYLMIASLAGAATPAVVFAGPAGDAGFAANSGKLIVSGRILGHGGKPLSGAVVEILAAHSDGDASVTTDADGRFMFTTAAAGRVDYRVLHDGIAEPMRQLRLAGAPGNPSARPHRDETGTWRATFGLSLA